MTTNANPREIKTSGGCGCPVDTSAAGRSTDRLGKETRMTEKEYLLQARYLDERINSKIPISGRDYARYNWIISALRGNM